MQQVGGCRSQVGNSASVGAEALRRFNVQTATGNLLLERISKASFH
jgi:hypothetical protein